MKKTGKVRSGQTRAPAGVEHRLIKPDGVSNVQIGASKGCGRVERANYNMTVACGIRMIPSRLPEENDRAHFMTGVSKTKVLIQSTMFKHFEQ